MMSDDTISHGPTWDTATRRDTERGTEDVGYFDGSCGQQAHHLTPLRHGPRTTVDRRPLERWSWVLFLRDRFAPISGDGERPLRTGRTVAEVELQALVALLDAYRRYAGQGPLLVLGDNRPSIDVLNGDARFQQPDLVTLVDQVATLAGRIPHGVRYQWLPRDGNRVADRLASHSRAQSWGAEACLWWVSSRLSAVASTSPADVRCRLCAQTKPARCPLSPAGAWSSAQE